MQKIFSRRKLLRDAGRASAILALSGTGRAQTSAAGTQNVLVNVHTKKTGARVPQNYTGLSYESAQLGNPDFFSARNAELLAFVDTLGAAGVLRIGGNTSEFTVWSPQGAGETEAVQGAVSPDRGGNGPRPKTPITLQAVRNLSSFVATAGWQLIYGLNLGTGTPEQAAEEAKAVSDTAGRWLYVFQIGNEPDLYHRNGLRPPNWGFPEYLSEWKKFRDAVRRAVPSARFAAPDVASNTEWIVSFAKEASDDIVELSGHYYAEGPPSDPAMTIARLLRPNPKLLKDIPAIMQACRSSGRPFRMTEGNSCYKGGKPGVSNTFASALWCGDYMLQLAQAGYVGVNLHGGDDGYYTPIAGSRIKGFSARPIYYGMLLAGQFAGTTILETALGETDVNMTAYAARSGSDLRVALFNKDEHHSAQIALGQDLGRTAHIWRLEAPSLDATEGAKLAGAEVSASGTWRPVHVERLESNEGRFAFHLPAATAALLFIRE